MTATTCLCTEIEFEVIGSFADVRLCHCTKCRKVSGSAFSANAKISRRNWKLKKGQEFVVEYEQAPGIFRAFCGKCGSPIYARLDRDPDNIRVRLGSFDNPEGVNVLGHVWVSSKAPWYDIADSETCFSDEESK